MKAWAENPVLRKEVTSRLSLRRQSKANRIAVAVICGAIVPLLYWFLGRMILNPMASGNDAREYYSIFLVGIELGLIVLLAPALTAGAITIEREKQTWNALLLSRLTPREIVWGKYWGSLTPVFVTVALFFPLNVLAAWRGQIPVGLFVGSHLLLALTIFFYGAIGLFCSWACRRTQAATMVSAAAVAVLVLGSAVGLMLWQSIIGYGTSNRAEDFVPLWSNPFFVQANYLEQAQSVTVHSSGTGVFITYLLGSAMATLTLLGILIARLADGPKEMTH